MILWVLLYQSDASLYGVEGVAAPFQDIHRRLNADLTILTGNYYHQAHSFEQNA
jgi:hypothetical protein